MKCKASKSFIKEGDFVKASTMLPHGHAFTVVGSVVKVSNEAITVRSRHTERDFDFKPEEVEPC